MHSYSIQKSEITLPIDLIIEDGVFIISTTTGSENLFGAPIIAQGKTREEADKRFWELVRFVSDYNRERSLALDRWKPLSVGPWKHTAGKWFIVFGFGFYFRMGKHMKHGWFIPFTNLNIMFTNHWKKHKEK